MAYCFGMMHPLQPIEISDRTPRFRQNDIVVHLVSLHPEVLDSLDSSAFSSEDKMQLAQLLGYSVGGFCELSFVTDDAKRTVRELLSEK